MSSKWDEYVKERKGSSRRGYGKGREETEEREKI